MRSIALALVLALSVSACFDSSKKECQQEVQASAERIRVLEEQNKKLAVENAERGRKIDALLVQIVAANDEATRVTLQKQLAAARAETDRLKKGGKPACTCQPSDPLCSCL